MKSLLRRSATLSVVAGMTLGSLFVGAASAASLTKDEILQKLRFVPVFTIANAQGAPLVLSPKEGNDGQSVAGAFISRTDAQAFLDRLKSNDPNLAKEVQVIPVSLAEVYQLNQQNQGKQNAFQFAYVPSQTQVEQATALLKQTGETRQFSGTPLFVARGGPNNAYLTISRGEQQVVPLFFNKEDLQAVLERSKQQNPEMANAQIQVANLEWVMQAMQKESNQLVKQLVLIPPRDSMEYVQRLMQQRQSGNLPQQPQK